MCTLEGKVEGIGCIAEREALVPGRYRFPTAAASLVREFEPFLSVIRSADLACKTCFRVTASTGLPSDIGRRYREILFVCRFYSHWLSRVAIFVTLP